MTADPKPTRKRPVNTTYVLDTSVLLADPNAISRFDEHAVVIPLVVINELESKRNDPELGWFARRALRNLEALRVKHGNLTEPMPANKQRGTVRVEINHQDRSGLPEALRADTNDHRILAVAHQLAAEGTTSVVVSKDMPLRLKASIVGLAAEEYLREQASDLHTGYDSINVERHVMDALCDGDTHPDLSAATSDMSCNTNLIVRAGGASALARVGPGNIVQRVVKRSTFGLEPKGAEQTFALGMLNDPNLGIVSLGGPAGTGKSILAIAAGLEAVMERGEHKKVVIFRPLYAVGGQDLGYLPGDADEKMGPWQRAVFDALESLTTSATIAEIVDRRMLEVLPLTHIRGRTLTDQFVIVDEAQNLERSVLLAMMSRLGEGSRVVLTHDVAQRDNLHVGRHDGVLAVIDRLIGNPMFGHLTMTKSRRSKIARVVTELLDD